MRALEIFPVIRRLLGPRAPLFRLGDWVEVKSAHEILATLDEQGSLDALPFMPEMLQFCGKTFRVYKSAHKTCDTIKTYQNRRMMNAVHLEGLRCDGESHGGCQAGCLLFWKDAWLKPVNTPDSKEGSIEALSVPRPPAGSMRLSCDAETLMRAAQVATAEEAAVEQYRCQATELVRATTPLRWCDPSQYITDLVSGNVRPRDFVRYVIIAAYNAFVRLNPVGRIRGLWRVSQLLHLYPYIRGLAGNKTPAEVLNLQVGELVQVRSKAEIMRTINERQRNRGLWFDTEMVPYCGRTFRVLRRVEKIIDEKTGKLIRMPNDCLILDGVTCGGCLSSDRLFCPRNLYPFWREIWLKRVAGNEGTSIPRPPSGKIL